MTSVSQTTQQTMVGWLVNKWPAKNVGGSDRPGYLSGDTEQKPWKTSPGFRSGNLRNECRMRYRIIRRIGWRLLLDHTGGKKIQSVGTMKIWLVLQQVLALCFRRTVVAVFSLVNCSNEDSFTLQVEVYHNRLDVSLTSTRPWDTRQYTLYTFCTSPIVLMDRSQMTQIRTWGGRRLMDQPSVRRDMMWTKNMPFLLLNEMWR